MEVPGIHFQDQKDSNDMYSNEINEMLLQNDHTFNKQNVSSAQ
jgi:hypothetical protein